MRSPKISPSRSRYRIGHNGSLTLLGDGNTGATGDTPTDLDVGRDGRFLYALSSGSGSVSAFRVADGGGLASLGATGALAPGAVGLVAI